MIDLHTHLLPEMDDGAKDRKTSLDLLEQCKKQGIYKIALTSHFDCEKETADSFFRRRSESFECLKEDASGLVTEFNFKLGAEVFYSAGLLNTDVHGLCMEGTDLLLMELPVGFRPQFMKELLYELQSEGIIPLIAHVERYPYVMDDPGILSTWIDAGALTHINAGTILRKDKRMKLCMKMIQWGLVHIIASDSHSPDRRPPRLGIAYDELNKQLGDYYVEQLKKNAEDLFLGKEPDYVDYHIPRKFLGRWI